MDNLWITLLIGGALLVGNLLILARAEHAAKRTERRRRAFDDGVTKLHELRVEVAGIAAAQDSLQQQLQRLRGKFYATKALEPPEAESPEQTRARLRAEHNLPRVGPRPLSAGNSE